MGPAVTVEAELATAHSLTAGDDGLARWEGEDLPGPAGRALPQPLCLHRLQHRRLPGRPHRETGQVLLQEGLDLSRMVVVPQAGLVEILGLRVDHAQTPQKIGVKITRRVSLWLPH